MRLGMSREPSMRQQHIRMLALLATTLAAGSVVARAQEQSQEPGTHAQSSQSHTDSVSQPQDIEDKNLRTERPTTVSDPVLERQLENMPKEQGDAQSEQAPSGLSQEVESQTQSSFQLQEEQVQGKSAADNVQEQNGAGPTSRAAGDGPQESPANAPPTQSLPQIQTSPPVLVVDHSLSEAEAERRSVMTAGLNVSAASELTPAYGAYPFQAYTATRVFALVDLKKIVHRFDTSVQYRGGGYFLKNTGSPWSEKQVHQLTILEQLRWEKTHLMIEDSFNEFPGASFGSNAFGGSSAYNLGLGGNSGIADFFGFSTFGLGSAEHISNVALAGVSQELTPRSTVTFVGAHAITDYLGAQSINSQQVSGLAGYSYMLSERSQLSLTGGYQYWRFTQYETSNAYSAQVGYTRQLSPRISLSASGGPQLLTSRSPTIITVGPVQIPVIASSRQTGITGEAAIGYGWSKGKLALMYGHIVTGGSGFFAGANSDIGTVTFDRPALRSWSTDFSAGFVHLSSLGNGAAGILNNAYQYWFAGAGVARRLGRHLSFSASYQFNSQTTTSGCTIASSCGSIMHTALLSLSWRTAPFNLDRGRDRDVPTVKPDSAPTNEQNP